MQKNLRIRIKQTKKLTVIVPKKQPPGRPSAARGWPTCGAGGSGVVEAPAAAKVGSALPLLPLFFPKW